MLRTFLVLIALSFQIAAYPQRQSVKGHGCWASNGDRHEECEFPFEYRGRQYNQCQPYGSSYWCATTSSYTDNPSRWGYCYQCDRQRYWAYSGGSATTQQPTTTTRPPQQSLVAATTSTTTTTPAPASCSPSGLTGCQTCTSSGAPGGTCMDSWTYNYIVYGGCDPAVTTDGRAWCYFSDNSNDWGYCNPDTCEAQAAVGAHGGHAGLHTTTVPPTPTSSASSGGTSVAQRLASNEYYTQGTPAHSRQQEEYYLARGMPYSECIGGALLFEPRPCGRDCRSVMGIDVDCDGVRGCACPEGSYWAENQGRCVTEDMCHQTDVYHITRPCGLTYNGLFRCQYPFTYQGTEYNACAPWKGRLWCSLDQGAYETHRRWGYCEGLVGRDEDKCPVAPAP